MGFSINCADGGLLKIHTEIKVAQKLGRVNTKKPLSLTPERKEQEATKSSWMLIKKKEKSFVIQAGLLKYLYFFLSNTTNDIFK